MSIKRQVLRLHRWASIGAALFWFIQCVTGMLLVFHWEMDDATVAGAERPVDFAAIERRAALLAPPASGLVVTSIWTTAGAPNRFDISIAGDAPGASRTIRVDGAGNVLRTRADGERFADGGIFTTLVVIHQNLLSGDTGSWIVGLSGCLLLSNILLGLGLAWPRRGSWKRSLTPPNRGPATARRFGWHRAIGLWAAAPAALLVAAGVMLVFEGGVSRLLQPLPIEAPGEASGQPDSDKMRVGLADAVGTALARYPGSTLSGIASFPEEGNAAYRIRILQPGETRRAFGTTTLFVSAVDGRVIADFDALAAPPGRRFVDILFPFHTGELGGTPGRTAVFLLGVWLATMIVLGVSLWMSRRPKQSPTRRPH